MHANTRRESNRKKKKKKLPDPGVADDAFLCRTLFRVGEGCRRVSIPCLAAWRKPKKVTHAIMKSPKIPILGEGVKLG